MTAASAANDIPTQLQHEAGGSLSPAEVDIFLAAKGLTMTPLAAQLAFYRALTQTIHYDVEGDIVECGVWRGGNLVIAALTLALKQCNKAVWGFDTFEGMVEPSAADGEKARRLFQEKRTGEYSDWCRASAGQVNRFLSMKCPGATFRLVKGKCEDTLRGSDLPARISVLRLDTDWYQSTKVELEVLYPRVTRGGFVFIDDYGAWQGSRKATDEFLADKSLYTHQIFSRSLQRNISCLVIKKP